MLEALFNIQNCMLACEPATLMMMSMAMTAGAGVMTHMGQKQAADEKTAYQNHLASLQKKAGDRKASAVIAQNLQAREATAKKGFNVSQEAAQAQADATLSASGAGVAGLSIGHLISDVSRQEGFLQQNLEYEQSLQNRELDRMLSDISLGTSQQMASTLSPVNYPSALGSMLKIGGSLAASGAKLQDYKGSHTDSTSTLDSELDYATIPDFRSSLKSGEQYV